ncbi:hypothetical protein CTAYLR_009147 [Chrysophaeum taylorii]|uniref:NAD(P)-binding domain-containing protein n=1 Tax=Chrysophaeum taylorii TaxID=2483200 RepID=A0AAD7UMH3_9STRA|nr:hypothetical protein CTAYLR_009147 [Chrysophaeum taylorii]
MSSKGITVVYATRGGMGDVGKFAALHALAHGNNVRVVALSSGKEEGSDLGCDVDVTDADLRDDVKRRLEAAQHEFSHVDVDDPDEARTALEGALENTGAVVACVGNRQISMSRWGGAAMEILVGAMGTKGVKRLVLLSSFGLTDDNVSGYWIVRVMWAAMLRTILGTARRDLLQLEAAATSSDLDYLIVRPVGLDPRAPPKGTWTIIRSNDRGSIPGLSISKSDVGTFMLQEAQNPTLHNETLLIVPSMSAESSS